jgi:cell division GTPase FtsZ
VTIMDIAKKAGIETVGLVTEPVEKNGKKKS